MSMKHSEYLIWELRRLRTREGLTQEAWAERMHYSPQHVSAVERGDRPALPDYLTSVDRQLGTSLAEFYEQFVKDETAPVWLREWITYEQQAIALRWYEVAWVPGLFQTQEYARALFGADGRLPVEEVEDRVDHRLKRQQRLFGDQPPHLVAVIDEGVLHRPIGGPAVMREQLFHLVRLNTEQRRIRIHVVPAGVGAYAGLDGPFVLATLPENDEAGYLDNRLNGQVVQGAADLADLRAQWEATLAEAMTLQQSTDLIAEVAKTWI